MLKENSNLKKATENLNVGPKGTDLEVKRLNAELSKLQETIGYMYKRAKVLSSSISQFYESHCVDSSYLDVTQEYVLSYENTINKLGKIFSHFEDMKEKLKTKRPINMYENIAHKSLTPHDNRQFNDADVKVRYRSKSPSPYNHHNYFQDYDKNKNFEQELRNGENPPNKSFKKNVTYI